MIYIRTYVRTYVHTYVHEIFRQLLLTECCNADAVHCWSNLLLRTRSCMLPNCCLNSWLRADSRPRGWAKMLTNTKICWVPMLVRGKRTWYLTPPLELVLHAAHPFITIYYNCIMLIHCWASTCTSLRRKVLTKTCRLFGSVCTCSPELLSCWCLCCTHLCWFRVLNPGMLQLHPRLCGCQSHPSLDGVHSTILVAW